MMLCAVMMFGAGSSKADNGTMMQYFEWNSEGDGSFWNDTKANAKSLGKIGITSLWLPPAYKGNSGTYDVGYGAYDLYDLGEFNQKGTVRTKYGTKAQYIAAIDALHDNGIDVYADIVLNHKAGADTTEIVYADKMDWNNRGHVLSSNLKIKAWTVFNFPGRNNKYSSFKWNYKHFDGVDWDDLSKQNGLFRFKNKTWDGPVSTENGNYDYLMFADLDMDNAEVVGELKAWGEWYVKTAKLDGFRLDAVKHIDYDFYEDWLKAVRSATGKELFTVGEYYSSNLGELNNYINVTGGTMSLFDFALHDKFYNASRGNGSFDMRYLFSDTLVSSNPVKAVTYVDNHDTQPGQSDWNVGANFKVQAYVAILTRNSGYPCIFYGDYYGTKDGKIPSYKTVIDRIMIARKDYAYGKMHDYFTNSDVIGWSLEGDSAHKNSGLAAIITDGKAGSIKMFVGKSHGGETWYDITGNYSGTVKISQDGYGTFSVKEKSASVWINSAGQEVTPKDNKITVYYKYPSTYRNGTYIHYQLGSGEWTEVPGKKMTEDKIAGYDAITIDMGSDLNIKFCFNNGNGTWDNNNGADYLLSAGTYYINNGAINEGTPKALTSLRGGTQATVKPVVTKKPATTKKPETTKKPVATNRPEKTDGPQATVKPEMTKAPLETDKPMVTDAPEQGGGGTIQEGAVLKKLNAAIYKVTEATVKIVITTIKIANSIK